MMCQQNSTAAKGSDEWDHSDVLQKLVAVCFGYESGQGAHGDRGRAFRGVTHDFAPSCFHSASTGAGNANAAPWGGVQVFDNAKVFGCGERI